MAAGGRHHRAGKVWRGKRLWGEGDAKGVGVRSVGWLVIKVFMAVKTSLASLYYPRSRSALPPSLPPPALGTGKEAPVGNETLKEVQR